MGGRAGQRRQGVTSVDGAAAGGSMVPFSASLAFVNFFHSFRVYEFVSAAGRVSGRGGDMSGRRDVVFVAPSLKVKVLYPLCFQIVRLGRRVKACHDYGLVG